MDIECIQQGSLQAMEELLFGHGTLLSDGLVLEHVMSMCCATLCVWSPCGCKQCETWKCV
jgi:hypothetical protein